MITVIDYGLGNVQAFVNVYNRLDIPVNVAKSIDDLALTTKIILPGVGSFDRAMQQFNSSGMRELIEKLVLEKEIPILGVCVGMQMLANSSEEGKLSGLGWVDGDVKKFDLISMVQSQNLPHMGWNNVVSEAEDVLFKDIKGEKKFYFLHSYYFDCYNQSNIIGVTDYGFNFTSAIKKKNIFGVQFHPEKSHHYGGQLLKNYSEI
jgi:imidazole glycerol-phosphate synthase subunit HisH